MIISPSSPLPLPLGDPGPQLLTCADGARRVSARRALGGVHAGPTIRPDAGAEAKIYHMW